MNLREKVGGVESATTAILSKRGSCKNARNLKLSPPLGGGLHYCAGKHLLYKKYIHNRTRRVSAASKSADLPLFLTRIRKKKTLVRTCPMATQPPRPVTEKDSRRPWRKAIPGAVERWGRGFRGPPAVGGTEHTLEISGTHLTLFVCIGWAERKSRCCKKHGCQKRRVRLRLMRRDFALQLATSWLHQHRQRARAACS